MQYKQADLTMLVSVQTTALAASICIRSKSTCLMAGDKSSGCVPGQFHRHAVQRRELMGVAHRSQAMTIWTHTCRTAATVSQIHFLNFFFCTTLGHTPFCIGAGSSSCVVSHGTSVCKMCMLFFTAIMLGKKGVNSNNSLKHTAAGYSELRGI